MRMRLDIASTSHQVLLVQINSFYSDPIACTLDYVSNRPYEEKEDVEKGKPHDQHTRIHSLMRKVSLSLFSTESNCFISNSFNKSNLSDLAIMPNLRNCSVSCLNYFRSL